LMESATLSFMKLASNLSLSLVNRRADSSARNPLRKLDFPYSAWSFVLYGPTRK
jgi:hypothetical protein